MVLDYIDKLEEIEQVIKDDADTILDAIDIDDLLKDPEGYLLSLSDAFLGEHMDEIEQCRDEAKKYANKILNKIK